MVNLSYAKVDSIQLQMMSVIWCDRVPVHDIPGYTETCVGTDVVDYVCIIH